jgi:hypothetical protein
MVIAVSVGKKMPSRIGGPREDEGEGEPEPMEPIQSKDDATREVMAAIKDGSESRLKSALEAFVYACKDSEEDPSSTEQPTGAEE